MKTAIAVLLLLATSGCGDEPGDSTPRPPGGATVSQTPDGPVPRLDLEDHGRTVTLAVGGTAIVTLVDPDIMWADPQVDGDAASISEDVSDSPAARSWTITANADGEATITMTGSPTCRSATPPCAAPDQLWAVRVLVG